MSRQDQSNRKRGADSLGDADSKAAVKRAKPDPAPILVSKPVYNRNLQIAAVEAFERSKHDLARHYIELAIRLFPEYAEPYLIYGYLSPGDFLTNFDKARQVNGNNPHLYLTAIHHQFTQKNINFPEIEQQIYLGRKNINKPFDFEWLALLNEVRKNQQINLKVLAERLNTFHVFYTEDSPLKEYYRLAGECLTKLLQQNLPHGMEVAQILMREHVSIQRFLPNSIWIGSGYFVLAQICYQLEDRTSTIVMLKKALCSTQDPQRRSTYLASFLKFIDLSKKSQSESIFEELYPLILETQADGDQKELIEKLQHTAIENIEILENSKLAFLLIKLAISKDPKNLLSIAILCWINMRMDVKKIIKFHAVSEDSKSLTPIARALTPLAPPGHHTEFEKFKVEEKDKPIFLHQYAYRQLIFFWCNQAILGDEKASGIALTYATRAAKFHPLIIDFPWISLLLKMVIQNQSSEQTITHVKEYHELISEEVITSEMAGNQSFKVFCKLAAECLVKLLPANFNSAKLLVFHLVMNHNHITLLAPRYMFRLNYIQLAVGFHSLGDDLKAEECMQNAFKGQISQFSKHELLATVLIENNFIDAKDPVIQSYKNNVNIFMEKFVPYLFKKSDYRSGKKTEVPTSPTSGLSLGGQTAA